MNPKDITDTWGETISASHIVNAFVYGSRDQEKRIRLYGDLNRSIIRDMVVIYKDSPEKQSR